MSFVDINKELTLEELYELYTEHGLRTECNDGKIMGLYKENDARLSA